MNSIVIVTTVAAIVLLLEKIWPGTRLKPVKGWYARAAFLNGVQALSAFSGAYLWDRWFVDISLLSIKSWAIMPQVMVGYIVITFIYYWWHRARHHTPVLWRCLHQLHHSPSRIEVVSSFYKHPLEIICNGILSSAILYSLLGMHAEAVAICVLVTGLAELIYHMNIKTPRWLGLFFQRPEMHRIHHQRGSHHYNYSDLPIWDMIFGTYKNPANISVETGFPDDNETRLIALLSGKELES